MISFNCVMEPLEDLFCVEFKTRADLVKRSAKIFTFTPILNWFSRMELTLTPKDRYYKAIKY